MATCANIGPAERRKRSRAGIIFVLLGVALVLSTWGGGLPVPLRAASAVFFFVGFVGLFQARARTCVALASRGVRDMDGGPETIADPAELAVVRAQARNVMVKSAVATLVVTVVALLLP
ncbi:MAG: hypothetical protein AB7T31_02105 [Gemmatimonadales bacterium]